MVFLAHTENEKGIPHVLSDHLHSVGQLAREFAEIVHSELVTVAEWTGKLHDIGKYRDAFQSYLRGAQPGGIDTQHAVYGAALAFQQGWPGPAFAIAGHHAGLHDLGKLQEFVTSEKYQLPERLTEIISRFETELGHIPKQITEPTFVHNDRYKAEFYIRMLFSVLVDADFLDTEAHYTGTRRSTRHLDAAGLLTQLNTERLARSSEGPINQLRHQIFEACVEAGRGPQGFFSLTVPTGGGKTLSGMAFALAHAAQHQLRRVIVVIPYLSIIEQNAAEYRRILDPESKGIVIEHHSAVSIPPGSENTNEPRVRSPLELAAENWEAPIIITTAVQFLESLFARSPARCRKLHNLAHSVVVLDEVQTLPAHLLNPTLNVMRELQTTYGVSFVFSTATQPAFRNSQTLSNGFRPGEIREIIPDPASLFAHLKRVEFVLPKTSEETVTWDELADRMASEQQVLCVVNTRRHAFELWEALSLRLSEAERPALFHLSSAMCAEHRLAVLGEIFEPQAGSIRARLKSGLPCRVVSTQLVEAGVDLDFPLVYRALGPLDSIVQAAGRCNRENRLRDATGMPRLGRVVIFRPAEARLPAGVYKTATDITAITLAQLSSAALATDPTVFERYFTQLYQSTATDVEHSNEPTIQEDREWLRFRSVAEKAKVIRQDPQAVVVAYSDEGRKRIDDLRSRPVTAGQPRFDRTDLRRFQRFMVSLHHHDFQLLQGLGQVHPLLPNLHLFVLSDGLYHDELGVILHQRPMEDFAL